MARNSMIEVMTMRRLPLLISLGLLTACGETAPAPAGEGGSSVARLDPVQMATSAAPAATAAPTQAPAGEKPASVKMLPLKRGFYVASDTPCGNASNATLSLLQRDGIGGARDFCKFERIGKTGATTYRVTEKCGELWGRGAEEETHTAVWTITDDRSYSRKTDAGWESSARYCEQSSLPADWRDNDIRDLIN